MPIDVVGYLKNEHGLETLGKGTKEGTARVRDAAGDEHEIDVTRMLADEGADLPSLGGIQFGSKASPMEQNALGFRDQMDFVTAQSSSDKARLLREKFGKDAVAYDADSGRFSVRDSEGWKVADGGSLAEIGAERKSIAGALMGGALGSAILPGVGTVVGGAVGATAGKALSLLEAEKRGIRTDLDAEEVSKELGKEFILNLAFGAAAEGVVAGAKVGGKLLKKAWQRVSKGSTEAVQEVIAAVDSTLSKTDMIDSMTNIKNPTEVSHYIDKTKDWVRAGGQGENPVIREMVDATQEVVTGVRKHEQGVFGKVVKDLEPTMKNEKLDFASGFDAVEQQFKSWNLVDQSGKFVDDAAERVASVTQADASRLKEVWTRIQALKKTSDSGQITGNQYLSMKGVLDDLAVQADAFAGTGHATPGLARNILSVRAGLEDTFYTSLKAKNPEAASRFFLANQRYAEKMALLEPLAKGGADNPQQVAQFVSRFLGEKSGITREGFKALTDGTPYANTDLVNRLFTMRAGINKSGLAATGAIGGIRVSPRVTASAARGAARLQEAGLRTLQSAARPVAFLRTVPNSSLPPLLKDPVFLKTLFQMSYSADEEAKTATKEMLNRSLGDNQGAGRDR